MITRLRALMRSLAQLSSPALQRALVDQRAEAEQWERIKASYPGVRIERGVRVQGWSADRLQLEPEVRIAHGTLLTLHAGGAGGTIEVGAGTWIGPYNNLRTCTRSRIRIGRKVLIAQFCTLVGSNHGIVPGTPITDQPADPARLDVVIGDDVWLGAGVTVLPGSRIGAGAVIGANSVVRGEIPPGQIWAGSPAVFQRARGER